MHFGIDMLTEPVGLIGNLFVSITSFYTSYGVLGEQDLAYVLFLFIVIRTSPIFNPVSKEKFTACF